MSDSRKITTPGASSEVQSFLRKLAQIPAVRPGESRGRLIFAMDATASRQPTWREAKRIQASMFEASAALGGLEIQLCHYRGLTEFAASPWFTQAADLQRRMAEVECIGGYTQIGRVLQHTLAEARRGRVNALVLVGDCMEENLDDLCKVAGELGLLGVRAFLFQEGQDPEAERAFRRIAELTGGAHCRFDAGSAQQLRDLLGAVATYAAGGLKALEELSQRRGGAALLLSRQVQKP